jgi:sugar lactone lactonase YvrE
MRKSVWLALGFLLVGSTLWAQPYLITTVAGGGLPPTGILGVSASFPAPQGVVADAKGDIYFSADTCVFKVTTAGNLTRLAGTGHAGNSGDGGPASSAQLAGPAGLAIDATGNLYIADRVSGAIRKVAVNGTITTVAGGFNNPWGIVVDAGGYLYAAESGNNVVRKMAPNGTVTTVAGNGTAGYSGDGGQATLAQLSQPLGLALDADGNLYIADNGNNRVREVAAADGSIATVAILAQLAGPIGVAVDAWGALYIADNGNNLIRAVAADGTITTLAGTGTGGYGGDGGYATHAALWRPYGVALDAAGTLYIADTLNNRIRRVDAANIITTVAGNGAAYAGDGGPATQSRLWFPEAVAADSAGNFYVADGNANAIRRVATDGTITTVAGTGAWGYSGDGGRAAGARLAYPEGVAVSAAGILYIADSDNNRVRKVALNGVITTVAGSGTAGYSGDGGPATGARLSSPFGLAVDSAGALYIADKANHRIRKVSPNGVITTIAGNGIAGYSGDGGSPTSAQLNAPQAVVVDAAGNVYIADTANNTVRMVANGKITAFAGNGTSGCSGDGGPALAAQLDSPRGVALDAGGNLFIADTANGVIRQVAKDGTIATVAGYGGWGYSGDGGPALAARFEAPCGVAVDAAGKVYVADTNNQAIRLLTGALLSVTQTHSGDFVQEQKGAVYSVVVSNAGGASTGGTVTLTETAPAGLTLVSMAGSGWSCSANTCTRADPLNPASSYPPVTVTVDVGPGAPSTLTNQVQVSGGNSGTASATDTTNIFPLPGAPVLVLPSNGASGVSAPVLTWNAASRATSYDVYLGTSSSPVLVGNTTGTTYTPGSLTPGALYYWQVAAKNDGVSSNSETWSFVTLIAPPSAPVLSAPANGATAVSLTPVLSWNASSAATSYDVYFGTAAAPPLVVSDTTATTFSPGTLNAGTPYYWRVVAKNTGGSNTSATWSFTTQVAAPVPVSPVNGAATVSLAPPLVWNPSAGASSYDVYFGTQAWPPLVTNTTATGYTPGALIGGELYFWRVVAKDSATSASSPVSSFTTPATPQTPDALQFVPVPPCRIADTRNSEGAFGGPTMDGGSERAFAVPQSGCDIPATAQAYSLNVTVVPEGPLSYLTLWPAGLARPIASTLNSAGGGVVANAAIVPAGAGGAVTVYVTNPTDVILDIDGYFDTADVSGSYSFYSAAPCRLADTRIGAGQFGGPSFFAGQARDFPIPLSACGIPPAAMAYSLNVTAVPDPVVHHLAYLTTWPTGTARPPVSTLNSWSGKAVANAAIVPGNTNGSISVYATDPTDVILDIDGYFALPGQQGALSFHPVTPCRVADTRGPAGPFGGPEMEAKSTRAFSIPAGVCNVPSTAAAYSMNVTVVPDGVLSYLTAWPAGSPQPSVSTLNSFDGAVVANAAIVPAGTNGAIEIYVTNRTHVILDINGYFAP